jgi:ribulose bisphosphate carboxylase small subunit
MRRTLLAKLPKNIKRKVVSMTVQRPNNDVAEFLDELDKFEKSSARTRHRVG